MEVLSNSVRKIAEGIENITMAATTASTPSTILLLGGTALIHDIKENVSAVQTDILIEDGTITKIEKQIPVPVGAHIIDCKDKIISPGFVDTRTQTTCP